MINENVIFVDLETTGNNTLYNRVIEVGLCEVVQGQLVSEWTSLVNPQVQIPPFIERYTGISNSMTSDAPTFADIKEELKNRLEGRLIAAHNVRFDYGFLKTEFKRHNISFNEKTLCTFRLSRHLYPQYKHHNLDAIIKRYGLNCKNRHRALDDARVLWDFVQALYQVLPKDTIEEAVKTILKKPGLPANLSSDLVDNLPESPGVYSFYGKKDSVLYIGKSINIRSRVLSHFSASRNSYRDTRITQQIRRLDWIETAGELGALLKEAHLIKEQMPIYNRRLRRIKNPCSLKLIEDAKGFIKPEITLLSNLDLVDLKDLYGIFLSRRKADKTVQDMIAEYSLCAKIMGIEKGSGPCFGYQLKRCRGACIDLESPELHNTRLTAALSGQRIKTWPFTGPIGVRETDITGEKTDIHIIDKWCYLMTVNNDYDLYEFLNDTKTYSFDIDSYKILTRYFKKKRKYLDIIELNIR